MLGNVCIVSITEFVRRLLANIQRGVRWSSLASASERQAEGARF
jgi:hypothetical protein